MEASESNLERFYGALKKKRHSKTHPLVHHTDYGFTHNLPETIFTNYYSKWQWQMASLHTKMLKPKLLTTFMRQFSGLYWVILWAPH